MKSIRGTVPAHCPDISITRIVEAQVQGRRLRGLGTALTDVAGDVSSTWINQLAGTGANVASVSEAGVYRGGLDVASRDRVVAAGINKKLELCQLIFKGTPPA